jgi:hypothetical protein
VLAIARATCTKIVERTLDVETSNLPGAACTLHRPPTTSAYAVTHASRGIEAARDTRHARAQAPRVRMRARDMHSSCDAGTGMFAKAAKRAPRHPPRCERHEPGRVRDAKRRATGRSAANTGRRRRREKTKSPHRRA